MHQLVLRESAQKELKKLPRQIMNRVVRKMSDLRVNPRLAGVKKLTGQDGLFRARVGDYRIVYEIDDVREVITVSLVAHRRDAYRDL